MMMIAAVVSIVVGVLFIFGVFAIRKALNETVKQNAVEK